MRFYILVCRLKNVYPELDNASEYDFLCQNSIEKLFQIAKFEKNIQLSKLIFSFNSMSNQILEHFKNELFLNPELAN